MSGGCPVLFASLLLAGAPAAFAENKHETLSADQIDFVLRDGNDFCFVELGDRTDASVLIDFNAKRERGELLVRRSAEEVDYSLRDPVKKVEHWTEAGIERTKFTLAGLSGGNRYEGALTVLRRQGIEDGIELKMSRNGRALHYDCASDFSEEAKR